MNSAARCEIGIVRQINQDSIFVHNTKFGCLSNLFIVADGMGGHNAGEVASKLSIEYFCQSVHENANVSINQEDVLDMLISAVSKTNKLVHDISLSNPAFEGMGTTFLCATILDNKLFLANVGDSRLYHMSGEKFIQISIDHSYPMELVRKGEITREQAEHHPYKNVVTRALGSHSELYADGFVVDVQSGDYVVLCSDGLTNMVEDNKIYETIKNGNYLDATAQHLVDTANHNGGVDNISVIIIEI